MVFAGKRASVSTSWSAEPNAALHVQPRVDGEDDGGETAADAASEHQVQAAATSTREKVVLIVAACWIVP